MANAVSLPEEYEKQFENHDDGDSEEEEEEEIEEAGNSKQNGSVVKRTDKYGFYGGDQYTDPTLASTVPVTVLRKRELKWLDMLENWEKWMSKRFKKVKDRCRKGIPPALRARSWQYLCGSKFLLDHNKGRYEDYLKQSGDAKNIDDITKDLHRQFPFHEMFVAKGGHGQEDLFCVLKAYSIHNATVGYCQAQAPIAAVLLMHMPAEQAFWCLVSICEKYLPGYYSAGLEAVQVDGDVLFGLLKRMNPAIHKHLKKQRVEPILCMTEWFMCVFTRTLPWASVLRVWDMFFCEGVKVMFRVALVIFRSTLGQPSQLSNCPSLYETLEVLRHIPPEILQEDFLTHEVNKLTVHERDMEKEHQKQMARRRAMKDASKSPKSESKKSKSKGKKMPESGS